MLDILVELDYSEPIGMQFFGYQEDLEKLLNRKIDLVTSDGLSKYKILLDSDVVRHFINGNQLLMLTRIFPNRFVMPDKVKNELCRSFASPLAPGTKKECSIWGTRL